MKTETKFWHLSPALDLLKEGNIFDGGGGRWKIELVSRDELWNCADEYLQLLGVYTGILSGSGKNVQGFSCACRVFLNASCKGFGHWRCVNVTCYNHSGFIGSPSARSQPEVVRLFSGGRRALCFGQTAFHICVLTADCVARSVPAPPDLRHQKLIGACWLVIKWGRWLRRLFGKVMVFLFYSF